MENKYEPLTEEQFLELKQNMTQVGAYLPDNLAPYIWSIFNKLRDENEAQPCTCASSGKHWKRAVDFINEWLKGKA